MNRGKVASVGAAHPCGHSGAGGSRLQSIFRLGITNARGEGVDPGVDLGGETASGDSTRVEHLAQSTTTAIGRTFGW